MWQIIKVQGTVGKAVNMAVHSTDKLLNHVILQNHLSKDFGNFVTIEYLETVEVPDFKLNHKVERVIALDDIKARFVEDTTSFEDDNSEGN
ncbi:hypothetical protein XaC1_7 [Xanthomonas phage XaC1]|nr:hypothetical protein XaC1_7 [Xanthomonas phage XaC1]